MILYEQDSAWVSGTGSTRFVSRPIIDDNRFPGPIEIQIVDPKEHPATVLSDFVDGSR